jgi:NAD(P)-dependent dehydrogenase (short-subunit alcohol dehydrogenase family)
MASPEEKGDCRTMRNLCEDRVVIVTGAARGLGRSHALAFARAGASVVVNDLDLGREGQQDPCEDSTESAAQKVVQEIRDAGGTAVADHSDVASWNGAKRLIDTAIETFGKLDVLVNNAGFLRDAMFVNATEDDWDAVIRVHLKGHFCPSRHAAAYWREQTKAGKRPCASIINTSSGSGLQGSVGQTNYAAAKAGIAAMTLVQAAELARYGVRANAIAPIARTRMTESVFGDMMKKPGEGFDAMLPDNVSPLVVWLGSRQAGFVSGRIFEVAGGRINLSDGFRPTGSVDKGGRWQPEELEGVVRQLIAGSPTPMPVYGAA